MPRISRRLLAAAVISAAVAGVAAAGSGVAVASTAAAEISPEQAGYTATGAQFKYIDALVYLRNPGQYASEIASFGDSVQLWSAGLGGDPRRHGQHLRVGLHPVRHHL